MIEVEVHKSLRLFLKSTPSEELSNWPHHLTMARLVARALRLNRSALIQTGYPPDLAYNAYRFSYLMPVLMWPGPVILATSSAVGQSLVQMEIPRLLSRYVGDSALNKPVINLSNSLVEEGDTWPYGNANSLFITTLENWLGDKLHNGPKFPSHIPVIIDGVDDLESCTRQLLTVSFGPLAWDELMLLRPDFSELIREIKIKLTKAIFQYPINPYQCHLLENSEQKLLEKLLQKLGKLPIFYHNFQQKWQNKTQLFWAEILRETGQFTLHCGPIEVSSSLREIWQKQSVVLIGGMLDVDAKAPIYRHEVGLDEITCVKFVPDSYGHRRKGQQELIQLYLPKGLPTPNTPQFQDCLIKELRRLILAKGEIKGLMVVLIGDTPLKSQVGTVLAADFGSRVQVEKSKVDDNSILVSGWEFWRQYQGMLPKPCLLVIATLPLPSLENPIVAARVGYYKQQGLDWFRFYLLPTALNEMQRALVPVRESQGMLALLDSRVIHRSYGQQVLAALTPVARISNLRDWGT